jgi:exopolysaccharide biosynthesis polyprenyl glycosylphosphotransferase
MQTAGTSTLDFKLLPARIGWTPKSLLPLSGIFCQVCDLASLGAVFFSLFIFSSLPQEGASLRQFLHLNISVQQMLVGTASFLLWRLILWGCGVYTPWRNRSHNNYLLRCLAALAACAVAVFLLEFWTHPYAEAVRTAAVFWGMALSLLMTTRLGIMIFYHHVYPLFRPERKLIILGSGARAVQVFKDLQENTEWDYSLLGFVDSEPQGGHVPPDMILGGTDDLEDLLMHQVVDEVVIALPMKSQYEVIGRAVAICEQLGIQSQYFSDHFGSQVTKRRSTAGALSGRIVLQVVHDDYRRHLKRFLDFSLALLGLLVLSPLLIVVGILVKLTSPGPMIFKQERFGLNKRRFWMLKFRSMCVDAEARMAALEHLNETTGPAFKIKKDPRITPIGGILRKLSIDELPQLINVLMGHMSLVGPRPLTIRDVGKFSESWLMRRFSVKPGLTCLWQIGGRSNTDFDRWIQLDLQYIDNWSLALDFKILCKTIPAVLKGSGAA